MERAAAILLTTVLVGCAGTKPGDDAGEATIAVTRTPTPVPPATGPSRPLPCVVMESTTEAEGLKEEKRWLHDHYPGWKNAGFHRLGVSGDAEHRRYYDHDDIVTSGSERVTACFDITKFYGKFG